MKHILLLASVLLLASIACTIEMPVRVTPTPSIGVASVPVNTQPIRVDMPVFTGTPQPTETEAPVYYPIGIVHVRTVEGEHVRYAYPGEPVQCVPQLSGWCLLMDGTRIWSGCLGIGDKGCKAK